MKAELFAFVVLYLRQPQHDRGVIKIGAVAFFTFCFVIPIPCYVHLMFFKLDVSNYNHYFI